MSDTSSNWEHLDYLDHVDHIDHIDHIDYIEPFEIEYNNLRLSKKRKGIFHSKQKKVSPTNIEEYKEEEPSKKRWFCCL